MTTYDVDELQLAARALNAGEFRRNGPRPRSIQAWSPSGRTITVAGAHRRAGTTTVALSLAHSIHPAPRLVEAGPLHTSGLSAATNAELGEAEPGWRRSTRGDVLIERSTTNQLNPTETPHPTATDRDSTVLDTGWDLISIAATDGWLSSATRNCALLIVTSATVPGLRALDLTLQALASDAVPHAVVVGPPSKRWPRSLRALRAATATRALEDLHRHDRLHTFPHDRDLHYAGLTAAPLPSTLTQAATTILGRLTAETTERHTP